MSTASSVKPEIAEITQAWEGEQVLSRYDAETGAWMFICIHSTQLGPAGGGTRMRVYPTPADALIDAMGLSEGMTRKMAAAGLPVGGGKSVISVREVPAPGDDRERLLSRYAELVDSLRGEYITGPDMNLTMDDLETMKKRTDHILGTAAGVIEGRTVAHGTALGTLHGILASVEYADGSPSLEGLTVLVQGVGEVGGLLVGMLVERGATVLVSDVNESRIRPLVERYGVEVVEPDSVLGTECDVYAPCAMGRVIGVEDVAGMRARVVAGCANIQLRSPQAGEAMREAGIVYGPDYVVNSGGALHCFGGEALGWSSETLLERTAEIEQRLRRIFESSEQHGISTQAAADRMVDEILAAGETR